MTDDLNSEGRKYVLTYTTGVVPHREEVERFHTKGAALTRYREINRVYLYVTLDELVVTRTRLKSSNGRLTPKQRKPKNRGGSVSK